MIIYLVLNIFVLLFYRFSCLIVPCSRFSEILIIAKRTPKALLLKASIARLHPGSRYQFLLITLLSQIAKRMSRAILFKLPVAKEDYNLGCNSIHCSAPKEHCISSSFLKEAVGVHWVQIMENVFECLADRV